MRHRSVPETLRGGDVLKTHATSFTTHLRRTRNLIPEGKTTKKLVLQNRRAVVLEVGNVEICWVRALVS